jgi:hypothetical protein
MRVKELKNLLNQIPDETEVLLRCQLHEKAGTGVNETTSIVSVTPNIGTDNKYIILNPDRGVRLCAFMPQDTAIVSCATCVRRQRIEICKTRGKKCSECLAVCECKSCGNENIEKEDVFANKPKYERKC